MIILVTPKCIPKVYLTFL